MSTPHEGLSEEAEVYSTAMLALIEIVRQNPIMPFVCIHGGEPAVAVYYVPQGCVAFPGVEIQPLCPQHVLTNGTIRGMRSVIDLSVDAAWSNHTGEEPDFWIRKDPDSGALIFEEGTSRQNAQPDPVIAEPSTE